MSLELVQDSLKKFLSEGLSGVNVTASSNSSNIKSIVNLFSQQNLNPSNLVDTIITGAVVSVVGISLTGLGTSFLTELSVGDSIKINGIIGVVETIYDDVSLDFTEVIDFSILGGESIYIPSSKTFVLLQEDVDGATRYSTTEDFSGYYISANNQSIPIASFDNDTNQITLSTVFSEEVLGYDSDTGTGTEIDMYVDKWIYMSTSNNSVSSNSNSCSIGHIERWDLFIKTKDDSDKSKMNQVCQDINDLIFSNYLNFPIYNSAETVILGYANIQRNSIYRRKLVDNENGTQSYLYSFLVEYRMDYGL